MSEDALIKKLKFILAVALVLYTMAEEAKPK